MNKIHKQLVLRKLVLCGLPQGENSGLSLCLSVCHSSKAPGKKLEDCLDKNIIKAKPYQSTKTCNMRCASLMSTLFIFLS